MNFYENITQSYLEFQMANGKLIHFKLITVMYGYFVSDIQTP